MNEELLTVKDAAKILKCGVNYVYKLTENGLLPYMVIGHRKIRRSSLDEFISKYENMDLTDFNNIIPVKEVSHHG